MFKRVLLVAGIISSTCSVSGAQDLGGAVAVGIRAGATHYEGDDFAAPLPRIYGSFFFEHYLTNRFSLEPSFNYGEIAAKTGLNAFKTRIYGGGILLRFALFGGESFRPYLAAGGQYFMREILDLPASHALAGSDSLKDNLFAVPVGGGVSIRLSEIVTLDFRGFYHYSFDDLYDAVDTGSDDDHFLSAAAGLTLTFRKKKDIDQDGLLTHEEKRYGTDPKKADTDGDGLNDRDELLIYKTNPLRKDSDQDGLVDGEEVLRLGTDPLEWDTDGDGMRDGFELQKVGTDPLKMDSDGDTLNDLDEVKIYRTDPRKADTDSDGLNDADEIKNFRTNPTKQDTDGDGLSDFDEINKYHTNPAQGDSDGDGLNDMDELTRYQTDPLKTDTDGGSIDDGTEVGRGSDPLQAGDDVAALDISASKIIVLEGITFKTGSAEIEPFSRQILERAFYTLKENPAINVEIRGYTDNTGTIVVNMRLSQRRAEMVRNYLLGKGIAPGRIRAFGYGPHDPVASNATPEGRRRNRRIEFVVVQ